MLWVPVTVSSLCGRGTREVCLLCCSAMFCQEGCRMRGDCVIISASSPCMGLVTCSQSSCSNSWCQPLWRSQSERGLISAPVAVCPDQQLPLPRPHPFPFTGQTPFQIDPCLISLEYFHRLNQAACKHSNCCVGEINLSPLMLTQQVAFDPCICGSQDAV